MQTHLKTRRRPGHTAGPTPERHVSRLHVCTQNMYTSHTHTQAVSRFLSSPLISSLFKTLTLTCSSNDAGSPPPTHTQNLNLQNKTQRASGCVFFPEAPRRLTTRTLRKCNHDWNVRNPGGLGLKSKCPRRLTLRGHCAAEEIQTLAILIS